MANTCFSTSYDLLFDQNFEQLRDNCLNEKQLFDDPHFSKDSIEGLRFWDLCVWKRPTEIVEAPQFVSEGVSRFDINQGDMLGDCWFLAATASLASYPELFTQVVPANQSFQANYAGIFHFRFWRFGRWVDVVIDDQLPVRVDKKTQKIVRYTASTDPNEFWMSLIEKAYAKFKGGYKSIHGGFPRMALLDFTGGFIESCALMFDELPTDLFYRILTAARQGAIMAGGIMLQKDRYAGLSGRHAYSITGAAVVDVVKDGVVKGKKRLVRVRNPHGVKDEEWNQGWADKSKEWEYLTQVTKTELNVNFQSDGEYWMSFRNFATHFDVMAISYVPNIGKCTVRKQYEFSDEWKSGENCGGDRNNPKYHTNPQFFFTITQDTTKKSRPVESKQTSKSVAEQSPAVTDKVIKTSSAKVFSAAGQDEDNDDSEEEEEVVEEEERIELDGDISDEEEMIIGEEDETTITVMIDLLTKIEKTETMKIGFDIYELADKKELPAKLDAEFFQKTKPMECCYGIAGYVRETSGRFKLRPGNYCVVPFSFADGLEESLSGGEFILGEMKDPLQDLTLTGPIIVRVFIQDVVA